MPSIPKPLAQTGEVTDVASEDEILLLLSAAARRGNVPAMKILLAEHRRGEQSAPEAPSVIDELASKRTKAASNR